MWSFRRPDGSGTQQASSDAGTPRGIRTPDLLLRRQLLYPAELLARIDPSQLSLCPKESRRLFFGEGGRSLRIRSFRRPGGSGVQQASSDVGAGDGNRTHVSSLEGWCSAIELHPRVHSLKA